MTKLFRKDKKSGGRAVPSLPCQLATSSLLTYNYVPVPDEGQVPLSTGWYGQMRHACDM
jgi:hypothetical protein